MIIHEVAQNTEDWHYLRLGRVGGSECAPLLVNGQNQTGLGTGAVTLIVKNVSDLITGELPDNYSSDKMDAGKDNEPLARKRYESINFTTVHEVGYISKGEYLGYSPDGLVSEDGLIEIKCPSGPEFVRYSLAHYKAQEKVSVIKKQYLAQMNWGMWITGRKWCDFVVYNPDFPRDIIVTRVFPDPGMQARFDEITPAYISAIESALKIMRAEE